MYTTFRRCGSNSRVGNFLEIPTIWKTKLPKTHRSMREIRQIGILFSHWEDESWAFLIMVHDSSGVFLHFHKDGLTEVTLSALMDDLMDRARNEYGGTPELGSGIVQTFAKSVMRGWTEYFTQMKIHIWRVRESILDF